MVNELSQGDLFELLDYAAVNDAALEFCEDCGEILKPDEHGPGRNGRHLCEECEQEDYFETCYPCCFCDDYQHDPEEKIQHRYLVLFNPSAGGDEKVSQGIYAIKEFPYCIQPLIGTGWLLSWALELKQPIMLPMTSPDGYAIGHLCGRCQDAAKYDV